MDKLPKSIWVDFNDHGEVVAGGPGEAKYEGETTYHLPDEPAYIGVKAIAEQENGDAVYTFHMSDSAKDKMAAEGIRLILHCAAAEMDIQTAYDWILSHIKPEGGDSHGAQE